MDDWRINGQEEYLQDEVLYKIVFPDFWEKERVEKRLFYQKIRRYAVRHVSLFPEKKDFLEEEKIGLLWHEHCDFCWEKATTDSECTFYCTMDMGHWICKACFEDFKERFNWTVGVTEALFN